MVPLSYHEIIDACQKPGCPLCYLAQHAVRRHLEQVIYDSVNDPPLRARLRESLGYCYEHAWQLPQAGASTPLGVAFIYRDLLNTVTKELEKGMYKRPSRFTFSQVAEAVDRNKPSISTQKGVQRLTPHEPCPACAHREQMTTLHVIALMDALGDEDAPMKDALANSGGLCMPHLRRAIELARSETAVATLLTLTIAKYRSLQAELSEFIRKNDYRFINEKMETEGDSWLRALSTLVGEENKPGNGR